MQSEYLIREYLESDYDAVEALWENTGLGGAHRGDNKDVIKRTINLGGKLLVLTDTKDSSIIGSSWLTVDGRRTYLHHFGIASQYQGKGLANLLLEASLTEAKKMGLQIKLEVHIDNLKALNLYKKAGFTYLGDYAVYIIRDIYKL